MTFQRRPAKAKSFSSATFHSSIQQKSLRNPKSNLESPKNFAMPFGNFPYGFPDGHTSCQRRICVYYLGSFETPILLQDAFGFEDSHMYVS